MHFVPKMEIAEFDHYFINHGHKNIIHDSWSLKRLLVKKKKTDPGNH